MTIEQERLTPTHFQIGDPVDINLDAAGRDWAGEPTYYIVGIDWHAKHGVTYTTSERWPPADGFTDEWPPNHLTSALKSPPIAGGEGEPFPADVRRLVIAARVVAFEDVGMEAMAELDDASEAFADRVKWDGEPAEECVGGVDDDMEAVVRAASLLDRNNVVADAVKALEKDMIENVIPAIDEDRRTQARLRAESLYKPLFGPTTSGDVGKLCERLRAGPRFGNGRPVGDQEERGLKDQAAALLIQMEARTAALEKALRAVDEIVEHNIVTKDGPNRARWEGEWIEGPPADMLHSVLRAFQKLAKDALLTSTPTPTEDRS